MVGQEQDGRALSARRMVHWPRAPDTFFLNIHSLCLLIVSGKGVFVSVSEKASSRCSSQGLHPSPSLCALT